MSCNVHSEVGYELVFGTSWSGYELVLGTSWLGYELAWYDLVRVRVDWKPWSCYLQLPNKSDLDQWPSDNLVEQSQSKIPPAVFKVTPAKIMQHLVSK